MLTNMEDRLINDHCRCLRTRGDNAILVDEVHIKFNDLCNKCAFSASDYELETILGHTGRIEATWRHKATNETVVMEAMAPHHERLGKCRLFEDGEFVVEIIP